VLRDGAESQRAECKDAKHQMFKLITMLNPNVPKTFKVPIRQIVDVIKFRLTGLLIDHEMGT
jgi:hypothetical protein